MAYDLSKVLVIGISSSALFDLADEDQIFRTKGLEEYCKYQIEHESDILKPGTGFPLAQALLRLNLVDPPQRRVEVVIMSRNNADTSLRIFNSIKNYNLDITRAALTSGEPLVKYLNPFKVDLFLSFHEEDVKNALLGGHAAAQIYKPPVDFTPSESQLRIAFDGDAVLFSEDSELIFKEKGIAAFHEHETKNALNPLEAGPFANFLRKIATLQAEMKGQQPPIRTALVTARNCPSEERVIRTLRNWGVRVDEAFFLGGVAKNEVLKAFQPHIFFDDQEVHCKPASVLVPSALVLPRRLPTQPAPLPLSETLIKEAPEPNIDALPSSPSTVD